MSVLDAIKSAVSKTGGAALRKLADINPTWGGKVGKAVDVIGKWTGNFFPETYASEYARSKGGYEEMRRIQENPKLTPEQKESKLKALEQKSGGSAITTDPNRIRLDPKDGYRPDWRDIALKLGKDVNSPEFAMYREYEAQLNAQKQSPPSRTTQDVISTVKNIPGAEQHLTESNLEDILNKWKSGTIQTTEDLARQIEETATRNAEAEYNTIKEALRTQKEEIQRLASQQREQLGKQKQFTEEGLREKETSEISNIEKQKQSFLQEKEETVETLARNWRDLSLEAQRVMRARGISDSAFAASQDARLMLDFNKGLRQIATKSQAALQDFADAVIETNKFYTRERQKLQMEYDNVFTNIDNWVRQSIQEIQNQENMALNRKLAEINNAILQANQLRAQIAQKIADQELGLAVWIQQAQMQLKTAVATAAQNKVSDAWKNIDKVRQNIDVVSKLLDNGGGFVQKFGPGGKLQWFVHGPAIKSDGTFDWVSVPVTEEFYNLKTMKNAAQISGGADIFSNLQGGKPTFREVYENIYGRRPPLPTAILSRP